ncbi:MAG TPA: hypothetical protein PKA88_30690, partial [Polyangiaceae bacterium]|nr:hypothetical protein [Polyangiaceae bacterium]
SVGFPLTARRLAPLGLARGALLIDQITTLKQASVLHGQKNQTEAAYRLVRDLHKRFRDTRISGLDKERALIRKLDETLTRLSGHKGEGGRVIARDAVSGLPH